MICLLQSLFLQSGTNDYMNSGFATLSFVRVIPPIPTTESPTATEGLSPGEDVVGIVIGSVFGALLLLLLLILLILMW